MLACYRICVLVKGLLSWCMPLKQGQAPGGLGSVIAKEAPTLHDLLPHLARAHQRCCLPCVCVLVKERERESFKVPGASGAMLACYRICVLVKGLLSWCMPLKQGQAPGGLGSVIAKEAPTLHDLPPHAARATSGAACCVFVC